MCNDNLKIIHDLKHPEDGNPVKIPIKDNKGNDVGYFLPITEKILDDEFILSEMTRWREENKDCFFTQFTPTVQRTKSWLENSVIPDDSRILFLVYYNEQLRGQYGMCNVSSYEAESDNLIIKGTDLHGGEVINIVKNMLDWGFESLALSSINSNILKSNKGILSLNKLLGFINNKEIPLKMIEKNGEKIFTEKLGIDNPDDYKIHYILTPKSKRWK